jgi:hypothetical protein
MRTDDTSRSLAHLFSELTDGVTSRRGGFMLNTGDIGMLRSLARLTAADASRSSHGGATIAAHTQHMRYGLSLMNQWASQGGNPFANAKWDEAWKISSVTDTQWAEIRDGFGQEAQAWLEVLKTPREIDGVGFSGLVSSIAHLAYHLGAIRQIDGSARGPKAGTF